MNNCLSWYEPSLLVAVTPPNWLLEKAHTPAIGLPWLSFTVPEMMPPVGSTPSAVVLAWLLTVAETDAGR